MEKLEVIEFGGKAGTRTVGKDRKFTYIILVEGKNRFK